MESTDHFYDLLFEVAKAIRALNQDNICGEGITFQQFNILDRIARAGALGMSDLNRLLNVEKSTTTRLVEPLVRRGLVRKERASYDPRVVELRLTDEGREVHRRALKCLEDFKSNVEQAIPEAEREPVYKAVKTYVSALMSGCCAGGRCCQ